MPKFPPKAETGATRRIQINILEKGYLSNLSNKVLSGGDLSNKQKLSTAQLERIARTYGSLAGKYDLYNLLFEQSNRELVVGDNVVNTQDLAMFTMLDHEKPRGWYWKPSGTATTDTSVCNGVPLAFYGARTVLGKKYCEWIDTASAIRCDMFLPYGLASTTIANGEPEQTAKKGLLRFLANSIVYDLEMCQEFRQDIENYATTRQPRMLKGETPERLLYNEGSYYMRCMILQSWCWYGPSRHANMITDIKDWDNESLDLNKSFSGLVPHEDTINPFMRYLKNERL